MGIKNCEKIYILHHVHEFEDGHEDVKLIGVFSTKEKALKALNNHKKLPGGYPNKILNAMMLAFFGGSIWQSTSLTYQIPNGKQSNS